MFKTHDWLVDGTEEILQGISVLIKKNWTRVTANVQFSSFLSLPCTQTPHSSSCECSTAPGVFRVTVHPSAKYSLCSGLRTRLNFLLMPHHMPKSTQTSEVQYISSKKTYTVHFIWPWIFTLAIFDSPYPQPFKYGRFIINCLSHSQRMKVSKRGEWCEEPCTVQSAPRQTAPRSKVSLWTALGRALQGKCREEDKLHKCVHFLTYMLIVYLMNSNIVSLCKQLSKYLQKVHC